MSVVTVILAPPASQNVDQSLVETTNLIGVLPQLPWNLHGPVTATVAYIPRYMLEALLCFLAVVHSSMLDGSMSNKLVSVQMRIDFLQTSFQLLVKEGFFKRVKELTLTSLIAACIEAPRKIARKVSPRSSDMEPTGNPHKSLRVGGVLDDTYDFAANIPYVWMPRGESMFRTGELLLAFGQRSKFSVRANKVGMGFYRTYHAFGYAVKPSSGLGHM